MVAMRGSSRTPRFRARPSSSAGCRRKTGSRSREGGRAKTCANILVRTRARVDAADFGGRRELDANLCALLCCRDLASNAPCTTASAGSASVAAPLCSTAQSSIAARRFAGWRAAAISGREYVRCPVRQPASVEER